MQPGSPVYEPASVIIGLVLMAQILFVFSELATAGGRHLVGGFWEWSLPIAVLFGALFVFSLGDYPPPGRPVRPTRRPSRRTTRLVGGMSVGQTARASRISSYDVSR